MNTKTKRVLHASLCIMFALTGCDTLLQDPAHANTKLAVSLSLSSASGGPAAAFDKTDTIRIALFTESSLRSINLSTVTLANVESVVLGAAVVPPTKDRFTPAAENRIRVEVPDNLEDFGVAIALTQAGRPLFLGVGFGVAERGSITEMELVLFPVPDRVATTAVPTLRTIGQTAPLAPAVVFATNDTIPDYRFTYQSSNTRVATVDSNGRVTAAGAGTAQITVSATHLVLPFTVTTTVPVTVAPTTGSASSASFNAAGPARHSDAGAPGVAKRIS